MEHANDIGAGLAAFIVSLCVLLSSAFIRKLIRGSSWRLDDFFISIDVLLTAAATAAIGSLVPNADTTGNGAIAIGGLVVVVDMMLVIVFATIQQSLLGRGDAFLVRPLLKSNRFWVLAIVCNFVAAGGLAVSIAFVYGSLA